MEIKQSRGSNFASIGGVLLLLLAVILTSYFGYARIAGYLLLFLVICVIALFWSYLVLKELQADLRPLQETCFPEEEIAMKLIVKNYSRLAAIWIDVWMPLKEQDCIHSLNHPVDGFLMIENGHLLPEIKRQKKDSETTPDSEKKASDEKCGIRQRFAWIKGKQKLTCRLDFYAEKRGVYRTDQLYLQSGDGFGMMVRGKIQPLREQAEVIVYPKIYPVNEELLQNRMKISDREGMGFYEDVTILKNVRTYESRDSFKTINWRMLAKQDELWTNLYETKAPEGICLLLDLQSFREQKTEVTKDGEKLCYVVRQEELEKKISLAASVFWKLIGEGVGCSLLLPGYGEIKDQILTGYYGKMAERQLLGALAEIDYKGETVSWQVERIAAYGAGLGRLYVLMAGGDEASYKKVETAIGQEGTYL